MTLPSARIDELLAWVDEEEADCLADDMPVTAQRYADFRALIAEVKAAQAEVDRLRTLATDRLYFLQAYEQMLGPTGLKVAAMWREKRVKRVHQSWGPQAHLLSGEERAQAILDTEEAVKKARRVESVDGVGNSNDGREDSQP